jgi:murein DD-endopeptidase MepM/ murein hydrolase activator NlpD
MLNTNIDDLLSQFINLIQSDKPKQSLKTEVKEVTTISSDQTFQAPIKGTYYVSGIFGVGDARHHGIHNGVDLRAPGGTPVYPMTNGKVIQVGYGNKSGNFIRIEHFNNLTTYYAHLGTVSVKIGDAVEKYTVIGTVGDSGNAKWTAPHIHFETRQSNQLVNPNKFFNIPAYSNLHSDEKLWLSQLDKEKAKSFKISQI